MTLLKTAIEVGKLAYRYGKDAGKFTSGETAIISRLPPNLRGDAKVIIKGFTTVTYGGIIADLLGSDDEGIGDDGQIPFSSTKPKTRKQFKTRRRHSRCPSNRHKYLRYSNRFNR